MRSARPGPAAAPAAGRGLGNAVRRHPGAALAAAALAVGVVSTCWMLLQTPDFFSGFDFQRMHLFYKAFFRQALLEGRLPLWNPYVGLGRPFMADIETATLYPPNLLVVALGVRWGVAACVALHQALAVYCGVRLGRLVGAGTAGSWLLGCGAAVGGAFISRLGAGLVEGYFSICWMPALLWLGAGLQDNWSGRRAAAFAAAVALSILAGHPALLFVEFLGAALFLVLRQPWPSLRGLPGLFLAAVLGAGIAAAALLPFMELVGQGNRPLSAASFALANGMPAQTWLSLILPSSRSFAPNWEYTAYCGLVPFFSALVAAPAWRDGNARAFLGMALVGGLFAAGGRGPFLGWALHVLPGAAALRIPSRYTLLVAFGVLGLGALGLSRRPARPGPPLLAGLCAGLAGLLWLSRHRLAGATEPGNTPLRCLALTVAALLVWAWHERARWPRARGAVALLLLGFCAGDWALGVRTQAPVYSGGSAPVGDAALGAAVRRAGLLVPHGAPPRISFYPREVRENAGMIEGFSTYNSYVAPSLARTWAYVHEAAGVAPSAMNYIQMSPAVYGRADRIDGINLAAEFDGGEGVLRVAVRPDPRAYLAFDDEVVDDWRAALDRMASGEDFHTRALVERGSAPEFLPSQGRHTASASVVDFAPERVEVRASGDAPAILVLAEAWYPGWRATVGGRPAAVFPVNGWMRGVLVPAGASQVVFSYHPRLLGAGLGISALSLAACAALAFGGPANRRSRIRA